jgi:hypothetical protein
MSRSSFDVLCDPRVEVYTCHPAHPQGRVLTFDELRTMLNHFGAGTISVALMSGANLSSRHFSAMESTLLVGGDTLQPKDIRFLRVTATWPNWPVVAQLALGGAMLFGGVGLVIDGLQWVGGGGGDLGAAWTGALVGTGVLGGLGILAAHKRLDVMIHEGIDQRRVLLPPIRSDEALESNRAEESFVPEEFAVATAKSAR